MNWLRDEHKKRIIELEEQAQQNKIINAQKEANYRERKKEHTEQVLQQFPIDILKTMSYCKYSYERHYIEHGRFPRCTPEECRYKWEISTSYWPFDFFAIKRHIEKNQGLKMEFDDDDDDWKFNEGLTITVSVRPSFFIKDACDHGIFRCFVSDLFSGFCKS